MVRDLTKGSITRNIIAFSVPVFLTYLFENLFAVVDSVMVGQLVSASALGSVASTAGVINLFIMLANGYAVGYKVILGQLFGAKRNREVREAVYTSLCSMGGISLLITLLGMVFTTPLLKLLGTVPALLPDASVYLRWYFLGIFAIVFRSGINNIFYALGETKLPMYLQGAQLGLHILLDFVFLKYARLGVVGLALAGIISRAVTLIPLVMILFKRLRDFPPARELFNQRLFRVITAQALPACLANSINVLGSLFITRLINSFGTYAVTGHSVAWSIINLVILFSNALGSGAGSFAAQNYGAHHFRRIKKAALFCMAVNGVYCILIAVLFRFCADNLAEFFMSADTEPALYEQIKAFSGYYISVISLFFAVYCCGHVCNEILRSVGKIKITVIAMLLQIIVRVSLGYGLTYFMGDIGIVWSTAACWIIAYAYTIPYFFIGRWIPHAKGMHRLQLEKEARV